MNLLRTPAKAIGALRGLLSSPGEEREGESGDPTAQGSPGGMRGRGTRRAQEEMKGRLLRALQQQERDPFLYPSFTRRPPHAVLSAYPLAEDAPSHWRCLGLFAQRLPPHQEPDVERTTRRDFFRLVGAVTGRWYDWEEPEEEGARGTLLELYNITNGLAMCVAAACLDAEADPWDMSLAQATRDVYLIRRLTEAEDMTLAREGSWNFHGCEVEDAGTFMHIMQTPLG